MKNIIFIAPPAAGKGTQSAKLESKYGYKHISTGDLLRNAIKEQTSLGKEVEAVIARGEFVSDEIVTNLLEEELQKVNSPFILDGYPRNIKQAQTLDNIMSKLNINDTIAIYLELDLNTSMKRALGREVCTGCGFSYNNQIDELKSKVEGICDTCGSVLKHRSDDTEETFKIRFDTYEKETNPLLDYYKEKNMLKIVDSSASSNVVFENIEQILTGEKENG